MNDFRQLFDKANTNFLEDAGFCAAGAKLKKNCRDIRFPLKTESKSKYFNFF